MSSSTDSSSAELYVDPAKLSRRRTGLSGNSLRTGLSTANSTALLPQDLLLELLQTDGNETVDTITHVQQEESSSQSTKREPQISLFIPKHLGQQSHDSAASNSSSSQQQQQQQTAVNNYSNSSLSSIASTANTHGHGINKYNHNNNDDSNTEYILGATKPESQTSMKKSHTLQYLKSKYNDKISKIKNNENEDLYIENFIMKTNNDYAYYQQTLARNTRHSKTYNLVSQIQHIINLKNHKNKESNNVQNNIETRNRTDRPNNNNNNNNNTKSNNNNNNNNSNNKRMYTSHSYVQLAKGSVNETGTRYLRTRSNIISRARSSINNKSTVGGMYASEHLGYDKCHCSNNNNNNQSIKEADDSIILSLLGRPRGRHSAYTMDNNTKNKAFSKSARGINNNGLKKNKNRQNYNQSNYASTNVLLPTICQKNNGIKPNKPEMKKTFSMTKNEFRKFKNKNKKSTKIGNNTNNQSNDDTSTISTHFNNGLFTYRHKNKNNNNGEDSVGLYGSDLKTIGMTNIELENYGFDYRSLQLRNQHSNKTEINQMNQNIILKLSMIHEQINQIQNQITENKPNLNWEAIENYNEKNIETMYKYADLAQQHCDLLIKSNQFKLQLMLNQLKMDAA